MSDEIMRRPSISEVAALVEPKANKELIMSTLE